MTSRAQGKCSRVTEVKAGISTMHITAIATLRAMLTPTSSVVKERNLPTDTDWGKKTRF